MKRNRDEKPVFLVPSSRPKLPQPPHLWAECPRGGRNEILRTPFIITKVPLEGSLYDIPEDDSFDVKMLVKARNRTIGLAIDLTPSVDIAAEGTLGSSDRNAWERHGVTLVHLPTVSSQQAPPSETAVDAFVKVVKSYHEKNPAMFISVFSTHGFNTVGSILVQYLVDVDSYSFEAAMLAFATARPPGVYSREHIKTLTTRLGGSTLAQDPRAPPWDTRGLAPAQSKSAAASAIAAMQAAAQSAAMKSISKSIASRPAKVPASYEHKLLGGANRVDSGSFVVGRPVEESVAVKLRGLISHMCATQVVDQFPGSQPVSLCQANMGNLRQYEYRVTWKADGTRYMMLIKGRDGVFMFDRHNAALHTPGLFFPYWKKPDQLLDNTLLDGELVIDYDEKNAPILRFLIYDIVSLDNFAVGARSLDDRLDAIARKIIAPRVAAAKVGRIVFEKEPFRIRAKPMYPLHDARKVWSSLVPKLTHETDGLIFTPVNVPYKAGTCYELLKWKPAHLNTVDFRFEVAREGDRLIGKLLARQQLELQVCGQMLFDDPEMYRKYNGKIVECQFVKEERRWNVLRVRSDKSAPNSLSTAKNVAISIEDGIEEDDLLDFLEAEKV